MVTKTTYTCDRCHQEVEQTNKYDGMPLFRVGVSVNGHASQERSQEWCRECCVATSLFDASAYRPKEKEAAPITPLTVEQQLVELIRAIASGEA